MHDLRRTPALLHEEDARSFLLRQWIVARAAIVARVAQFVPSALPLEERVEACGRLLQLMFDHLRTDGLDALRSAVADFQTGCPDGWEPTQYAVAFHSALIEALRPALSGEAPDRVIDVTTLLAQALQSCVAMMVEARESVARRAAVAKARELEDTVQALHKAQEALVRQARMKAMGELAGGVAHDVNNALNAVLLRTNLLRREISGESTRHVDVIESVVRESAATVQRLQEFARERSEHAPQPLDVNAILRDAAETANPVWNDGRAQGRSVEVWMDVAKVPTVLADPLELKEMFVGLLLNCGQAMNGTGRIEITTRSRGNRVVVDIADSGPGFSPSHLERAFEPFFTTRGPASAGLGLALAYALVQRLGGEIRAMNREEGGARVRVELPATIPADATPPEPVPAVGGRSLLLVDDDPDNREALKEMLQIQGYQVECASDGLEALRIFDPSRHEAVLCDVGMPNMDGWELATELRGRHPDSVIALLTGWGADAANDDRSKLVDAVFTKPLEFDALVAFLETVPRH
jgi:signal transduction histidine kinase